MSCTYRKNLDKWRISTSILSHIGHQCTKEEWDLYPQQCRLTGQELNDARATFQDMNIPPSVIAKSLSKKTGKHITARRVINYDLKSSRNIKGVVDSKEMDTYLKGILDDGGVVESRDVEEVTTALLITTARMKRRLDEQKPETLLLDTTFKTNDNGYRILAICYLDTETGKTALAAMAFLESEDDGNIGFVARKFANRLMNPKVVLVDKDLDQLEILKQEWKCTMLLCHFHVMKYWKNLVATALVTANVKEDCIDDLQAILYSHSPESYETKVSLFKKKYADVEVRTGKAKYERMIDYLERNWFKSCELWAMYHRKGLPTLGDNTTNRVESTFSALKRHLDATIGRNSRLERLIPALMNFAENMCLDNYNTTGLKRLQPVVEEKF